MRKFTLFAFAALLALPLFGQQKHQASQDQLEARATLDVHLRQKLHGEDNLLQAKSIDPGTSVRPNYRGAGTNAVTPVELGRASNAYTILRAEQNQLIAVDSLSMVAFIHRHDVTIWGGGGTENGKYRYDLSVDNGVTFTNDIGPLQTNYLNYGRYPNITAFNPGSTSNPFDANLLYMGPTNHFPTPGWIGYVVGLSDVTQSTPTATENYIFDTEPTLLPGGLCQGMDGEFWAVDWPWDGSAVMDSLWVLKGTYNTTTQDVDWAHHFTIQPSFDKTYDGSIYGVGPQIAFSPDGMTGYVAILGDVTGNTSNAAMSPIFWKSTDGGATWGSAIEVDMNSVAWVSDSLQSLWIDSTGAPASNGMATTGFDFDLVVDVNGNPHFGVVIGTAADGYAISSGLAKFMGDVHSTDGGSTWDITYLSPVLAFRGEFGTPDSQGSLLSMDNFVQTSRTEDGTKVFFSWVDSDTLVTGFGESNNIAPNLRITGVDVTNGDRTCVRMLTDGDLLWDGRVLYPTLSPITLDDGAGTYNMPVAFIEMIANDQGQPCKFWYLGNDATFLSTSFSAPSNFEFYWGGSGFDDCVLASTNDPVEPANANLFQSYPNPNYGFANIRFDLVEAGEVRMNLVNIYGQEVAVLAEGHYPSGMTTLEVDTRELAAGIYFYNLNVGEQTFTRKMIVTK